MGGRQGKEVAPEINVEAPSRPGSEMSIMSIPLTTPDSAAALGSAENIRPPRSARTARSAKTAKSHRSDRTARTARTARTDRTAKSSRSKRTAAASARSGMTHFDGRSDGAFTRASSARSVLSHKEEKTDGKRPSSKRKAPVPVTIEFATFRFRPDTDYSEAFHMFTTMEDYFYGYPPPHPPSKPKTHILDDIDFTDVDKRAKSVTQDKMRGPVSALVYFLTEPFKDDLSRVRAIYMWLTQMNIDKIKFTLRQPKDGTVMSYLWKIKKKKGNYAHFFSVMCSNAGLLSIVINGYAKGISYAVGMRMNADLHNAEWNAVLVGKSWRFIDSHWGSVAIGSDDPKNVIYKMGDESYFLMDPEEFIFTHYPEEERWQLITPPKILSEFEKKAYIKERFFQLGMKVLSNPDWELPAEDGETEIIFGVDPGRQKHLQFKCEVFIKEGSLKEWHRILEVTEQPDMVHFSKPGVLSIKVRYPEVGKYKVEIFGKDLKRKEKDYDFDWIAIYKATVENINEDYYAFPRVGEAGWGPGPDLIEAGLRAETHETGVIYADDGLAKLGFILDELQDEEVSLSHKLGTLDDIFEDLPMEEEGFRQTSTGYMMDINAPPGNEYALAIYTKVPDKKGGFVDKNICNYLVVCRDRSEEENFRQKDIERVRKQLKEANTKRCIDNIEVAINCVETKEYEKYMMEEYEHARDLLSRLLNLQTLLHNVLAIDQKVMNDIVNTIHPHASIVNAMKAALLLIGNYEEETKIWRNIALLLSKGGRESVRRRMNLFNIKKLGIDVCLGSKKLLAESDLEDCKALPGIDKFYLWAEGVIAEKEKITDKAKWEKAKPKTKGGPGGGVSVFVTNVKNKMPYSLV